MSQDNARQAGLTKMIADLRAEQSNLAASRGMCEPEWERPRWDALQSVIDYLAALSADASNAATVPVTKSVIAAAREVIKADRAQTLTDTHIQALEYAISLAHHSEDGRNMVGATGQGHNCPSCGALLEEVTQGENSMLNREQFDAAKNGDWFCRHCAPDGRKYRYFWNRDLAAPAAPALVASLGQRNSTTLANVDELVAPTAVRADEVDAEVINAGLDGVEGNLDTAADADPHGVPPGAGSNLHDSCLESGIQAAPAPAAPAPKDECGMTADDWRQVERDAAPAPAAPKCTRCEYIGKCDCEPAPVVQANRVMDAEILELAGMHGGVIKDAWTFVAHAGLLRFMRAAFALHDARQHQSGEAGADARRLDRLRDESWDLRSFCVGEEDVGWRVIEFHQAAPHERVVAEVFKDDPRAAVDAAMTNRAQQGGERG